MISGSSRPAVSIWKNYSEILKIALDAGVSKIIPHIYSSIIDKASGNTRPPDVRQLLEMTNS